MASSEEMSRMSLASFLAKAKQCLAQSIRSKGEHSASFVIGNESADLDSITSALVYGYIQSNTSANRKSNRYIIPVTNIPSSQLRLRPELAPLLAHADLKPSDLVTLDDLGKLHETLPPASTEWTLVDHNVLQGSLGKNYIDRVTGAIDHHVDEGKVPEDAKPRIIEKTGSCNSHVINYCRDAWDSISSSELSVGNTHGQGEAVSDDAALTSTCDAQLAKLALGSILIDTVNLIATDKVTDHDQRAIKFLESKINASPKIGRTYNRDAFFKEINDAKCNLDELTGEEILEKDYKSWSEGELKLGISSCVRSIKYLQRKEQDLTPLLVDFAHARDLDVYAVLCAHNENAHFERQCLLLAAKEGKGVEVAKKFAETKAEELQLRGSSTQVAQSPAPWLKLWEQANLSASRKRIAPLLREVMRQ